MSIAPEEKIINPVDSVTITARLKGNDVFATNGGQYVGYAADLHVLDAYGELLESIPMEVVDDRFEVKRTFQEGTYYYKAVVTGNYIEKESEKVGPLISSADALTEEEQNNTLIQNWNGRVTSDDTVYVLGDAFWKNEENSIRIMERLRGHKHLIQGNHDRVKGKLRPYWESIEQYAEVNDENRLVILSHYPILFYKNQHYGAVMLYGHVHNTREWKLVEKWKNEQWAMGIPSRLINVGCMMDYMRYTPRTLTELLDANPMPEIARDRKDGSAVESAE